MFVEATNQKAACTVHCILLCTVVISLPVDQLLEHGASNTKVGGSIRYTGKVKTDKMSIAFVVVVE